MGIKSKMKGILTTLNLIFCGVLAEVKTIDSYLYSDGRSNAVQFRPIHYYDLLKQVGLLK